jgi:hypothetical protein
VNTYVYLHLADITTKFDVVSLCHSAAHTAFISLVLSIQLYCGTAVRRLLK